MPIFKSNWGSVPTEVGGAWVWTTWHASNRRIALPAEPQPPHCCCKPTSIKSLLYHCEPLTSLPHSTKQVWAGIHHRFAKLLSPSTFKQVDILGFIHSVNLEEYWHSDDWRPRRGEKDVFYRSQSVWTWTEKSSTCRNSSRRRKTLQTQRLSDRWFVGSTKTIQRAAQSTKDGKSISDLCVAFPKLKHSHTAWWVGPQKRNMLFIFILMFWISGLLCFSLSVLFLLDLSLLLSSLFSQLVLSLYYFTRCGCQGNWH